MRWWPIFWLQGFLAAGFHGKFFVGFLRRERENRREKRDRVREMERE